MSISEERADAIFMAIGAIQANLSALERAKTDRVDTGILNSKFEALEKDKADKIDLIRLRDAILTDVHAQIKDLSERIGDRFNSTNSQILAIRESQAQLADALDRMAEKDDLRGAEIARLGDVLSDLAKTLRDQADADAAEKRNRWKRARRIAHVSAQYTFQAVAGFMFLIIFLREGVTGLPDAFHYLRAAFGAP